MTEDMLKDCLLYNGLYTFDYFSISDIRVEDGVVVFNEEESDVFGYFEERRFDLLDILAWVYKQSKTR